MLLEEVRYCRPGTLEEAIEVLRADEDARVLAGGQSLLNVMKHRIASPGTLVDLGGVSGLDYVREQDGGIRIGAMTTYDQLDGSETLRAVHPVVAEVVGSLADQQVRNRGTIGGNLCYSDPTSNLPPLVVALGATLVVTGGDGDREVEAGDFFGGAYSPNLSAGEVLTEVRIPLPEPGTGYGYQSLRASAHGWGLVHAAAGVTLEGGTVEDCRVVLGCVSEAPVRAATMETALRGQSPDRETVREAAEGVGDEIDPLPDGHASAGYRRRMAGVMARRAVLEAIQRAGG